MVNCQRTGNVAIVLNADIARERERERESYRWLAVHAMVSGLSFLVASAVHVPLSASHHAVSSAFADSISLAIHSSGSPGTGGGYPVDGLVIF